MDNPGLPPNARPLTTEELRRTKPDRHAFLTLPRTPIHLVLDRLGSAANIGNIFRLADALRVEHLWLCNSPISLDSHRFRRAAKATQKWVPYTLAADSLEVVKALKARGVTVLGVELATTSVDLADARFTPPVAIVVGQESDGINPRVLAACDLVTHLQMLGLGNSVNVSNAMAAVGYWALAAINGRVVSGVRS
jgi:tRNA G18 (ribose-2'-O)-methylase SpoU